MKPTDNLVFIWPKRWRGGEAFYALRNGMIVVDMDSGVNDRPKVPSRKHITAMREEIKLVENTLANYRGWIVKATKLMKGGRGK